MGFIEGLPAPKWVPGPPFLFQNLSSLDVENQQAKFECKSIVRSFSRE